MIYTLRIVMAATLKTVASPQSGSHNFSSFGIMFVQIAVHSRTRANRFS